LKISSLPTFALKSPNKIFMFYLGNWSNTRPSSSEVVLYIISLIITLRTTILHQRPLNIIYDILSLTNSTPLTADMILLCTRKPVPNWSSFSSSSSYTY
jgi:hypothetical protein